MPREKRLTVGGPDRVDGVWKTALAGACALATVTENDSARDLVGARDTCQAFFVNFIKNQRTLRLSPAMATGVTTRLFGASDLVALLVESV